MTLGEEMLVYNRADNRAHALNPVSRDVFRLCQDSTSRSRAEQRLSERYAILPEQASAIIDCGLSKLAAAGLIEGPQTPGFGQRELRRMLGNASMVPAVASIVAPRPEVDPP